MSLPVFERLAVVGLGLIGGSAALAAQQTGAAAEVRGVDPYRKEAGDFPLVSAAEAAGWADCVLLAVPIEAMGDAMSALAPRLAPRTLLTDTASVKGPVADLARRLLPHPENCVGAHPMAGGHASGFEHARADLFREAPCILALEGHEPPRAVDRIDEFWQCLGAVTVRKTPAEHDSITAALSHLPHVIAFAFARGLPDRDLLQLAGPGLRDFIRIARANPKLWCEILLMNRARLAEEAARFEKNMGTILDALGRGDRATLEGILEEARAALKNIGD